MIQFFEAIRKEAKQVEDELDPCPFTFAHTSYWCGHPGCRNS
jgi:hypothetical protein